MKKSVININNQIINVSPQKMKLVMDSLRGRELNHSLNFLTFSPQKASRKIYKLLQGIAKALKKEKKLKECPSNFLIKRIKVDQAKIQKKVIYRAKGRTNLIRKRYCLVSLSIEENYNNGTKN